VGFKAYVATAVGRRAEVALVAARPGHRQDPHYATLSERGCSETPRYHPANPQVPEAAVLGARLSQTGAAAKPNYETPVQQRELGHPLARNLCPALQEMCNSMVEFAGLQLY